MKLIAALAFLVCSFSTVAGQMLAVPPTPLTGVPASVVPTSNCVGIANNGAAACNTYYGWKGTVGRFKQNYYRNVASVYANGVNLALKPLPGDTDTFALGITPGGKAWGRSSWKFYTSTIVTWDAYGEPTGYGPGTATDADDLGRIARDDAIFNPATGVWEAVPGAYKIMALSNNGDSAGVFVVTDIDGVEHAGLWRTRDFQARPEVEDACTFPCIDDVYQLPAQVRMNASGAVVWYLTYATLPPLGFRALPGEAGLTILDGVALASINTPGDAVGAGSILRAAGALEALPLSGGFTSAVATGINDAGLISGYGKIGTQTYFRAFIYQP
jgi:hypothetical protein